MADGQGLRSKLDALWRWLQDIFSTSTPTSAGPTHRARYHLKGVVPPGMRQLTGVSPADLKIEEHLQYKTRIGARVDLTLEKAHGEVTLEFPYDKPSSFPENAHTQLKKMQVQNSSSQEAMVGYLGFSNQAHTSFHIGEVGLETVPAKIPVWIPVAHVERYRVQNSVAVTRIRYNLVEPSSAAVSLEVSLVDDSEIKPDEALLEEFTSFPERLQIRLRIRSEVGNISQEVRERLMQRVSDAKTQARAVLDKAAKGRPQNANEDEWNAWYQAARRRSEVFSALQHDLEELMKGPVQTITAARISKVFDRFKDEVTLPDKVRQDLDHLRASVYGHLGGIKLAYLGLEWPFDEGGNRCAANGITWVYNPETGMMETRDVSLSWNSRLGLYEIELNLEMYRPATPDAVIRGKLVLEIDKLISGSRVCWLSVDERESSIKCSAKTIIGVDIEEIVLRKVFERRDLYPQRRLVFPGVLPTQDRAWDVENILRDVGLTVMGSPSSIMRNETEMWLIKARQQKAGDPTRIWLLLYGDMCEGTTTITYDEGRRTLQGPKTLGDTHIVLFARTMSNHTDIDTLFANIQTSLEHRFRAFRTL